MFDYNPLLYMAYIICILVGLSRSYSSHKKNPAQSKYKPIINIRI